MYWAKPLTKKRRVARAHAMCCTPQVRQIVDACTASIGAPRKIPLAAVMAILYFHAVSNPAAMTIPSIIRDVDDLSPSQLRNLGVPRGVNVTYKRLYSGVRALCEKAGYGIHVDHNHDLVVYAMTGEVQPCPEACPSMDLTPEEFSTTVIQVSLPAAFPQTSCIAVDGTDVESFWVALRHPKLDKHGNEYFCADHDARRGKRTPTDRRSNPFYTGYEAHVATQVPPAGEESIAQVTIGLALRPGVTDRAGAARNLIQAISRWQRVDEALFDRGYTTAKPENFARPLRALGILVVQDLHTTQRGVTAGPIPHTLWIDGALYSDAIPPGLRDLDPPEISMTTAERDTVRKAFDAREAYRFTPLNRHNDALGTQRFKGPALAGHVRCQNVSSSMRRGTLIPTTTCEQGADCGCGKTVTVLDTDHERDRQELPWQSTRWHESYKRRSLVEGLNAQFRFQNLNVNRGFIRMRGYGAANLLLAITLAGRNVCRLHDWYTTRELPDPWGEELGEDPDDRILDHYTRTRGRRSRRGPPSEQHAPDNMTT